MRLNPVMGDIFVFASSAGTVSAISDLLLRRLLGTWQ
jgi:hypothetical protein